MGNTIYIMNYYTAHVMLFGEKEQVLRNSLRKVNFDNYQAIVSFVNINNEHWKLLVIHNAVSNTVFLVDPAGCSTEDADSQSAAEKSWYLLLKFLRT
ncbi:hypothetical protein JOQ06_019219 [Pogonophryne albipinna]|uniref:Uncharacterized protein n=1 Tax=Pogonophryne albipinna TaxID=1090488 RepID=A0AAD6ARZ8_9TELE|nr:hypothetical protein JOQ06_019219 [Pogonophryne albipinna]